MYYPYLRAKQNELFCLRELLTEGKLNDEIIPVLEPVKFCKALFDTLQAFISAGRDIALIHNPQVGQFFQEYNKMLKDIDEEESPEKAEKLRQKVAEYKRILNDKRIITTYISDDRIIEKILAGTILVEDSFIINKKDGDYDFYLENGSQLKAKVTFIPKDEDFKDEVDGEVVLLENCFQKARRNKDYIDNTDEFFSKNHLIYKKRGYQGFSDYSIIGEDFEESGFAPAAIAIHIVYYDEKKQLRIHHFVSDSNLSISDPARKFEEAMKKLLEWEHYKNIRKTMGLNKLVQYYSDGKFPGLGVIKRYSMMHHLELVGDFLEDEE